MKKNSMNMKKLKTMLVALWMMGGVAAMAQTPDASQQPALREDFKTEELEKFVDISTKVQTVQMGAQDTMVSAIKEEGMTVEQFNKLAQAQQSPGAASTATKEDQDKFQKASAKIMKIQEGIMGKVEQTIQKAGMDVQTYQQIVYAYQNSEKVKSALNQIVQQAQQKLQQGQAAPAPTKP